MRYSSHRFVRKVPGLNPTENMWDTARKCLAARYQLPATISKLRLNLLEILAAIPQQFMDNILLSTDIRCKACSALRRHHISYYRLDFSCQPPVTSKFLFSVQLYSKLHFNKILLYPFFSFFGSSVHFFHILTSRGSYDMNCADFENFFMTMTLN